MRFSKVASVPLVLHDPYFSIWSSYDHLNDGETTHWSGNPYHLRGYVDVGGKRFCFLGNPGLATPLPQVSLDISATRTVCGFENGTMAFTTSFLSPLVLSDLALASRPVSYLSVSFSRMPDEPVEVVFQVDGTVVCHDDDAVDGYVTEDKRFCWGSMGKANQSPLSESGDKVTVDWGWVFFGGERGHARIAFDRLERTLEIALRPDSCGEAHCVLAYDQGYVVDYFGTLLRGYWRTRWSTMEEAIGDALASRQEVESLCASIDAKVEREAEAAINADYARLCAVSWRVAVAAHQIAVGPEGEVLFLSKENSSNGCIATVDVSYPSVPLFLLEGKDCIMGMLEPVFTFARKPVWNKPYAPHDVGRFPYATGQVYGRNPQWSTEKRSDAATLVNPPYARYPASADVYDGEMQMPVEECGNMLILCAALMLRYGKTPLLSHHLDLLKQWADYLVSYGLDPGSQLCTDDFAGHLAHNANLAVKAIFGIESYSLLVGGTEGAAYHAIAKDYAARWERMAFTGDHTVLAYGMKESWSLLYNMVWNRIFPRPLFSETVTKAVSAFYKGKLNEWGIPLDSRKDYTKSDWTMWVAALSLDGELRQALAGRLCHFLIDSPSRIPFSDWYDTKTGRYVSFIARSVQGGIFMPLLVRHWNGIKRGIGDGVLL